MTLPSIFDSPDVISQFARSDRPGIVLDFDGTLSELAPTPDEALLHPRCTNALRRLARGYPLVAVLSGRGVRDLADKVAVPDVVCVGNHGAEYLVNGSYSVAPSVMLDNEAVSQALHHLEEVVDLPGLVYEDKRFSASVHFRAADPAQAIRRLQQALPNAPGIEHLEVFWGKMILEIRPARALNKGHAIQALVSDYSLDAVLFVGDDTTDVDGMLALRGLILRPAVGIAVVSPESPSALLENVDFGLYGVGEVATLLEQLADRRGKSSVERRHVL